MAGPSLFRPSNITSGLQGYWKLDEASGSRVDSSVNGYNLTDNNTVASVAFDYWKTGENSADFESGNSESLSVASPTNLNITSTYTVSAWLRQETKTGDRMIVGKFVPNTGYYVSITSGVEVHIHHNSTDYQISGLTFDLGKWYHLVVVYDDTNDLFSVYQNGNLVGVIAATVNPTSNSNTFEVGARGDGLDFFDGLLKDVAIWNVALTPLQIKSLALGVEL